MPLNETTLQVVLGMKIEKFLSVLIDLNECVDEDEQNLTQFLLKNYLDTFREVL